MVEIGLLSLSLIIIVELAVKPRSDILVLRSANTSCVVHSVLPVAETESVVVIEDIPRAEATVPARVPPVIVSLPVASIKAVPPF